MNRFSLLATLAALMVFSFGLANAAQQVILDQVSQGLVSGDSVANGAVVKFDLRTQNLGGNGGDVTAYTNGFRIWTFKNGAYTNAYTPMVWDTANLGWPDRFDLIYAVNTYSVNGNGEDSVSFGGTRVTGAGIPQGFDDVTYFISTTPSGEGDTLCLDSTWTPPGGAFIWATTAGTIATGWDGPHCYVVFTPPNFEPEWTDCPADGNADHCAIYQKTVHATDRENDPLTYTNLGPGNMVPGVGLVNLSYQPLGVGPVTFTLLVEDGQPGHVGDTCEWTITFDNSGGVGSFTGGCDTETPVAAGNCVVQDHDAVSSDCDNIWFIICDISGDPGVGATIDIDPNTGAVTVCADAADGGKTYVVDVGITDGYDTLCGCIQSFPVLDQFPFAVVIEKTHMSLQGQHEYVDVCVTEGTELVGGFDILIAYDRSALNFQTIIEGDIFARCGWEYITWRTWFWPSYEPHFFWGGIIHVIAIADMNNGNVHPQCYDVAGHCLFTIDFLVTDNRLFECQYVPIRFFWTDCGDNTFSNIGGDTLWVSRHVIEWSTGIDIADPNTGFPTYTGVQAECLVGGGEGKPAPVPFIDFYNGGVDIACADSLDDRGDINLNGIPYEIADAVVFTNYFIYGLAAFHVNIQGQIAATDVNADGLTLTVGDLVFLVRVIVGDAIPYPKLAVDASYTVKHGVVSVDAEMGAALVLVENNVTPTLLAENMEMKYAYDAEAGLTRVLVYSLEGHSFSGDFLNANGNVVSIEMGSYDGAVVKATELPADYALHQNYPNPYNPTTTMSFSLPTHSDYTLTVYNVTGQKVEEFVGEADAGTVSIEFNASDLASGVYFYKLVAGDFSATKKMVVLK